MTSVLFDGSFSHPTLTDGVTSKHIDVNGATFIGVQAAVDDVTPGALAFAAGRVDTTTFTYDTVANTANGDYAVVKDTTGASWAIALSKEVKEAGTTTFPDKATIAAADHIVYTDAAGLKWSVYADKTGSDPAPTGAIYAAIPAARKSSFNVTTDTTAAQVAARAVAALNALTGFSTAVVLTDNADGTVSYIMGVVGVCTDAAPYNDAEGGAGTISNSVTTQGVAIGTPTGAIWTAIPAANKGIAVITADTTAAQVAARAETAWDALTGFSAVITSTTTSASIAMINIVRGICGAGQVKNIGDTGAGSITVVETTAGIDSDVNVANNTITETAHGYTTGLKGQASSTGTLPAGLSASTDYFVIVVDADNYKLATSLANAQAGTAIDITDQGTSAATHTFTPTALAGATLTLQYSMNEASLAAGVWTNVASATSITVDANLGILVTAPAYRYVRYVLAITAGVLTVTNYIRAVNSN